MKEIERIQINILGVAEHRWIGKKEINEDSNRFYYSRKDSHRNGVELIVKKWIASSVTGFIPISGSTEIR